MTPTTSSEASSSAPLVVAMVAPSLSILGGQAVQAQRLLDAWREDREISAFLVPINPEFPVLLRPLARVKYLRTIATQLVYLPSLVRHLRRSDVVHVFSASYWSFLLAPLPAVIVARLLGRPVLVNYHSGEAPDHLRRSAIARTHPTSGRPEHRAIPVFSSRSSRSTPSPRRSSRTSSTARSSGFGYAIRCSRDCSPLATSNRSMTWRARCERLASFNAATRLQR